MPIGLSLCLVLALACCYLTSAHATERTSFPSRALLEDDDEPLNANATAPTTSTDDTSYTLVYACSGTCYAGEPKPNGNETDRLTVSKTERERERERERETLHARETRGCGGRTSSALCSPHSSHSARAPPHADPTALLSSAMMEKPSRWR